MFLAVSTTSLPRKGVSMAVTRRSINGMSSDKQQAEARVLIQALGLTEERACQLSKYELQELVRQAGLTALTQGALVFINIDDTGAGPAKPAPALVRPSASSSLGPGPPRHYLQEAAEAAREAVTPDPEVARSTDRQGWRGWLRRLWPWSRSKD